MVAGFLPKEQCVRGISCSGDVWYRGSGGFCVYTDGVGNVIVLVSQIPLPVHSTVQCGASYREGVWRIAVRRAGGDGL